MPDIPSGCFRLLDQSLMQRRCVAQTYKPPCPRTALAEPVAHKKYAIFRVPLALPVFRNKLVGEAPVNGELARCVELWLMSARAERKIS